MSVSLLRRGLELLGVPEGEELLPRDVQPGREGGRGWGQEPRGCERSRPGLASVGWEP